MPVFYFDIDDGDGLLTDEEGTEHRDLDAAIAEAVAVLPSLAKETFRHGSGRDLVATVRNREGRAVFKATLSLATERLGAD